MNKNRESRKRRKQSNKQTQQIENMVVINSTISISTLNVNGLNTSAKEIGFQGGPLVLGYKKPTSNRKIQVVTEKNRAC